MNIHYPYQINNNHRTATSGQEMYIKQLIEQLLMTSPGERVNRPDFGSGLNQMLFSPGSDELAIANEFLIKGALMQWLGDLILIETVEVNVLEEKLTVTIQYMIRKNQQRHIDKFTLSNNFSAV